MNMEQIWLQADTLGHLSNLLDHFKSICSDKPYSNHLLCIFAGSELLAIWQLLLAAYTCMMSFALERVVGPNNDRTFKRVVSFSFKPAQFQEKKLQGFSCTPDIMSLFWFFLRKPLATSMVMVENGYSRHLYIAVCHIDWNCKQPTMTCHVKSI